MKRNLLYIALSLVAILLLSGCEKTSNMVLMHNTLTYISYDQQTIDVRSSDFGAEIIEHNYANGYGIIRFDRPITQIGDWAFYDCDSLTSITIPDTVNSIGNRAFSNCNDLSRVYCMATTPPKLGINAFDENHSRFIIYVPSESVELYKSAPNWNNYAKMIIGYDL